MRWADIDPYDLLDLSSSGIHRFAAGRTTLFDAGLLNLLPRLARDDRDDAQPVSLAHDLGYVQGWRVAGRALAVFPNATETDAWQFAAQCGTWLGLGRIAPEHTAHLPAPLIWQHSPQASGGPTEASGAAVSGCPFLAGFFAGCVSRILQQTVACDETRCVGQGQSACEFALRSGAALHADEARRLPRLQVIAEHWPEVWPEAASAVQAPDDDLGLGARSPQMREVVATAARVAPIDLTVLITGESGVGKERLAEFVHRRSKRAAQPFIPVNCAALPDALLESELFGHRRGAFTGALDEHIGLFEAANRGTIFLDEIGEVSPSLQAKLLRVLGDLTIRRVGDTKYRPVDVRVIAATNRDLPRDVREGRFREDLFYRLNVVALHVPPLRDRPEDLRLLLRTLLTQAIRRLGCQLVGYTPQALDALLTYAWPGNIRELENAIDRACAMARGSRIDLADLPDSLRRPTVRVAPFTPRPLRDVEREHILAVLDAARGNRVRAAELLQVSRQTLFRRLREYGLPTTGDSEMRPDASRPVKAD